MAKSLDSAKTRVWERHDLDLQDSFPTSPINLISFPLNPSPLQLFQPSFGRNLLILRSKWPEDLDIICICFQRFFKSRADEVMLKSPLDPCVRGRAFPAVGLRTVKQCCRSFQSVARDDSLYREQIVYMSSNLYHLSAFPYVLMKVDRAIRRCPGHPG
jgi:hypothetical protein